MQRLLVATDLTARSDRALDRAVALSRDFRLELTVLHVVDEELPARVADRAKADAEAAIADQLESYAGLDRQLLAVKVMFGNAVKEILLEAERTDADLVVMGTHRKDYEGLSELFLGTTVERVIRHGRQPVLVAKDPATKPYRRALVAVDFSAYSRRAVEFAAKITQNGELMLVHAYEIPFKSLFLGRSAGEDLPKIERLQVDSLLHEEMQAFLRAFPDLPANVRHTMHEGSPRAVITRQVEELRPDLLVLGTHGRTGVAHALLGSVAEALLSEPPCDVLAVKAW